MVKLFVAKSFYYNGKIYRPSSIFKIEEDKLDSVKHLIDAGFLTNSFKEAVDGKEEEIEIEKFPDPNNQIEVGKVEEKEPETPADEVDLGSNVKTIGKVDDYSPDKSISEESSINLNDLTKKELLDIAKDYGLSVKPNIKKTDLIELLEKAMGNK